MTVTNPVGVAGDPDVSVVDGGEEELTELTEEDSTTAHLNYRGPGQELPGPGLTPPASLQPQCSADRADQHDDGQPQPSSLNAVLDILEGRPSLGEPLSPDCPQSALLLFVCYQWRRELETGQDRTPHLSSDLLQ